MHSPSGRHLVGSFVLFAACASVATAQNSQKAQRPDSSRVRFRDPEHITGDPTGLRVDFNGLMAPRYPDDARAACSHVVHDPDSRVATRARYSLDTG